MAQGASCCRYQRRIASGNWSNRNASSEPLVLTTLRIDVFLSCGKLLFQLRSLRARERQLRNTRPDVSAAEAEGFELTDEKKAESSTAGTSSSTQAAAARAQLNADWAAWEMQAILQL